MSQTAYAQKKVFNLLNKHGINLFDLPDFPWYNWIEEDMEKDTVDSLVPDITWEILDSSGMDRETVNQICYPDK